MLLTFKLATIDDLENISLITKSIVDFMINDLKIDQWSYEYPIKKDFLNDIKKKQLYILSSNDDIIGYICINKEVYPQYEQVTWDEKDNFLTLHRVAINPKYHSKGFGKILFHQAEKVIKERGISAIRIDTYSLNQPMNKLINNMGFNFKGEMQYVKDKANWNCYEKKLKQTF